MAYDSGPKPQVKMLTFAFSESEMFWENPQKEIKLSKAKSSFFVILYKVFLLVSKII